MTSTHRKVKFPEFPPKSKLSDTNQEMWIQPSELSEDQDDGKTNQEMTKTWRGKMKQKRKVYQSRRV